MYLDVYEPSTIGTARGFGMWPGWLIVMNRLLVFDVKVQPLRNHFISQEQHEVVPDVKLVYLLIWQSYPTRSWFLTTIKIA